MLRSRSTAAVDGSLLGALLIGGGLMVLVAPPANAHCKGKHAPELHGNICPHDNDDGSIGGDLATDGAIGHAGGAPPCGGGETTGDFYDRAALSKIASSSSAPRAATAR